MTDATSNLIVENGDAEMWCDRCGAEIPIAVSYTHLTLPTKA